MTRAQVGSLLLLARIYVELGRPMRAMLLLVPVRKADPFNAEAARIALRACLALGRVDDALELIERLIEVEPRTEDLAYALVCKVRLLSRRRHVDAARQAWTEYVALCRCSGLSVAEALK